MMLNKLMLECGTDVPLLSIGVVLHQPTIKEISMIGGEETLYKGCEVLRFTKDRLEKVSEGKIDLKDIPDFDIIMTMISSKDPIAVSHKINFLQVISLLFPDYQIKLETKPCQIVLTKDEDTRIINSTNYVELRDVINAIFALEKSDSDDYNPSGVLAEQLVKKFEERKRKLQEAAGINDEDNFNIFGRYISILQVGLHIDILTLSNYTVYQLFNSFNRFTCWSTYDMGSRIQLAGGKVSDEDLGEDWANWMRDID